VIDTPTLAAALAYAARGWSVFPCQHGTKEPFPGTHGVKDASTDEATIRAWWTRWPDANVALACGPESGVYVVDVDVDPEKGVNGWESLKELPDLPATVRQNTPRGGAHFLFRADTPPRNKNSFRNGIDIRAGGYYIMLTPSIHPNGKPYRWEADYGPGEIELAEFPAALRPAEAPKTPPPWERKPQAPRTAPAAPGGPAGTPVLERARLYLQECDPAVQGQAGHDKLLGAARALVVGFELDEGTALDLLWSEYNPRCSPPWDRGKPGDVKDFERKAREAARTPGQNRRGWLLDECGLRGCDEAAAAHANMIAERLLASMDRKMAVDPEKKAVIHKAAGKRKEFDPDEAWPEWMVSPTGLVGDCARWMDGGAGCKQPKLYVVASFVGVGTLMARKFRDTSNGRTNLYAMGVAKSSSGKDHPGKCLSQLFSAAGADCLLGGNRVTSDSAIEVALTGSPAQLFQFDEAGDM
jgi:hypothetical protein